MSGRENQGKNGLKIHLCEQGLNHNIYYDQSSPDNMYFFHHETAMVAYVAFGFITFQMKAVLTSWWANQHQN